MTSKMASGCSCSNRSPVSGVVHSNDVEVVHFVQFRLALFAILYLHEFSGIPGKSGAEEG